MLNKYVVVDKDTGEIVDDQYLLDQAAGSKPSGSCLGDVLNACKGVDVKLDNILCNIEKIKASHAQMANVLSFGMR